MIKRTYLLIPAFILLILSHARAQSLVYTLDNGMITSLDASKASVLVGMSALVYGGTQYESDRERGTFRLITDMLKRGTTHRTKSDIAEQISLLGDSFDIFAGTEYWAIQATVPPESLPDLLEFTRDMLFNSVFPDAELSKVRKIAIQSIKTLDDSPIHSMFDFYQSIFYPDFYDASKRRIENIRRIERQLLIENYQKFFRPDNLVLALSGNFDTVMARELLFTIFGSLPSPNKTFKREPVEQHPVPLPRYEEKMGGLTQSGIFIGTQLPGFDRANRAVIEVLNAVLKNSIGGRLFNAIREKRGLVYSIRPYQSLRVKPYTWFIFGTSRRKNITEVKLQTLVVLNRIRKEPPTEEELRIAKNYLKTRLAIVYQSPVNRAHYNAERLLRGERIREYWGRIAEIDRINREDIISFIESYFPDHWTVLILR